jgi:hypothetical protein
MLFSASSGFLNTDGFARVETDTCTYYYKGVFYMRGRKAGRESIVAFAQEYESSGVLPFAKAFGAYSCAIAHPKGQTIFFADNSNLNCFYVGPNAISSSFLELIRYENASTFDDEALCEFLALGGVFYGKTLVKGITLSASDSTYVCSDETLRREDKGVGDIDAPTAIEDVADFFRDTAYALSDESVSLSLTGGYDSRLVFVCLKDHLPLNVFISCSDESAPDVYWAKQAALAAGRTLEIVNVAKPSVNEDYLRQLFDYADGLAPFVDDSYMRISAFMLNRRDTGYTCYLTGDGGVRHKDWYWLQDFPFYRMRHTNLGRFYDQRLQVIRTSIPVGERLEEPYRGLRPRMIKGMRPYLMAINTESYDSVGFHVQGDLVKPKYTIHSRVVPSYAPLWELELLRYSFHLPRRERFFYNSMRKVITARSKAVARTPTVYGTTASSEPRYLARDVVFQGIDYSRKAVRLLGRTLLHRSLFVGHTSTWSAEVEVRELDLSRRALDYCTSERLIRPGTRVSDVSYPVLGRIIQLYLLGERMDVLGREGATGAW